jgi:hypothetical protein
MAWNYLIVAGLLEIGWALLLKRTDGFTRPGPSVATLVLYIASIWLLSLALRTSPPAPAMPSGWALRSGDGARRPPLPEQAGHRVAARLDRADRPWSYRPAAGGRGKRCGPHMPET